MKAILASIRPEWMAKILSGRKTVEIRKTAPKDWKDYLSGKTKIKPKPRTAYIYCTKDLKCGLRWNGNDCNGKVVAKFLLKEVEEILYLPTIEEAHQHGCYLCKLEDKFKDGFNEEEYSDYYTEGGDDNYLLFYSCLKGSKLHSYLKGGKGYAWNISDLVIFEHPMELGDFKQAKLPNPKKIRFANWKANYYWALGDFCNKHPQMTASEIIRTFDDSISIKRPPRSWMYVESLLGIDTIDLL